MACRADVFHVLHKFLIGVVKFGGYPSRIFNPLVKLLDCYAVDFLCVRNQNPRTGKIVLCYGKCADKAFAHFVKPLFCDLLFCWRLFSGSLHFKCGDCVFFFLYNFLKRNSLVLSFLFFLAECGSEFPDGHF